MKPLYLEFCGFNSFSERAVIDFKQLLSGGIFGIFGDTGAGKSTVLDCIGFALYGRVNRVGREGSSITDVVNYNCAKAEVNFEFEAEWNGERSIYRVERSLQRNRGVQKAVLYKTERERHTAIAEGAAQVNKKIEEEIVSISYDDFKKCIALPQGEFSEFLRSSRKDRLSLVAKLFSLERYGNELYCKVKDRLTEKQAALSGVEGELKAYEGVTEEFLKELKNEAESCSQKVKSASSACDVAKVEQERCAALLKNKNDWRAANEKLSELLSERKEQEKKRAALGKLQSAKRICETQRDADDARLKYELSRTKEFGLKSQENALKKSLQVEQEAFAALKTDEALEKSRADLVRAENAKKDIEELKETEKRLLRARDAYKEHKKTKLDPFVDFDYTGEKSILKSEKETLPKEDNLFDFVNNQFKSALLAEEYAAFSAELSALLKKYPGIGADVLPLIDKYTVRGAVANIDIYAQAELFKKSARRKEEINQRLSALEIKQAAYQSATEREKDLRKEGERLQNEYIARKTSLAEITALGTPEDIRRRIDELTKRKMRHEESEQKTKDRLFSLQREISAEEAKKNNYAESLEKAEKQIKELLTEFSFSSTEEAKNILLCYGDYDTIKTETDKYFIDLGIAQKEEERLKKLIENVTLSEEDYSEKCETLARFQNALNIARDEEAVKRAEISRAEINLVKKKELEKKFRTQLTEVGLYERLKALTTNNKFMEFIAVEYLQEMAANANNLLLNLTNGRYFLVYDKNFEVGDNFNGGALRGVHTLSGGETFLVSLALALSLSSSIHQKSLRPIEFFFLDEGFGSLDDELVDTVMDSLERLKNEHFSIGIISHVGELKNRLENKITIIKSDGERGSSVRTY